MKNLKILVFAFSLVLPLFFVKTASAQEDQSQIAKKYGITFPVLELGGCTDVSSCKTFCEDPVNRETCVNFAKTKGFYKDDDLSNRQKELLDEAKTELGCDSINSCQAACHEEVNREKCSSFAQKHKLNGGQTADPKKAELLEKAKSVLGCDSYDSCKNFCQNEQNRQKCSDFAKQTGLRGGEQRIGPGGCTSEETCKAFCSDPNNFQICRSFSQSAGGQFRGPGGCNDEQSCRAYCQQNPDNCRSFGARGGEDISKKFCQDNPDKCIDGKPEDSGRDVERFCLQNPEKCKYIASPYPATSSSSGGNNPTPGPKSTQSYDSNPQDGCRRSGGNWNGSNCQMPNQIYSGGRPGGPGASYSGYSSAGDGSHGGGYDETGKYVGGDYGAYDSAGRYIGTPSTGTINPEPTNTQTPPPSTPAPQPETTQQPQQTQQPQPQPTEQPQSTPNPTPQVQGASTSSLPYQWILNLFGL